MQFKYLNGYRKPNSLRCSSQSSWMPWRRYLSVKTSGNVTDHDGADDVRREFGLLKTEV